MTAATTVGAGRQTAGGRAIARPRPARARPAQPGCKGTVAGTGSCG